MKRLEICYKIIPVLLVLLWSQGALAQFTDQKYIKRSGKIENDATIRIDNKHGNITVRPWDKDSVYFEVQVKGSSKSLEKLRLQFERTSINIQINEFFAEAVTMIDQSVFTKEWKKVKKMAGYKNEQVQINYVVHVPKMANLELLNEFGNIYMSNHLGEIEVVMKHGSFRAGNVQRIKRFEADFTNIFIRKATIANMNLSFCEAEIEQLKSWTITSRNSSRIETDQVEKMVISSQNDNIEIGTIDQLRIIGKLSKLKVKKITTQCYASLKYGKIHIRSFACGLESFTLKMQMGSVDIGMTTECQLNVSARGESLSFNYGDIPHAMKPDGDLFKGTVGDGEKASGLNISGSQCSFNFYQN